jgi:hypothetical protein
VSPALQATLHRKLIQTGLILVNEVSKLAKKISIDRVIACNMVSFEGELTLRIEHCSSDHCHTLTTAACPFFLATLSALPTVERYWITFEIVYLFDDRYG